jgi:hypothetical protein
MRAQSLVAGPAWAARRAGKPGGCFDQSHAGARSPPSSRPKGLVVYFHGYTHTAHSWAEHIRRTAAQDGVIAARATRASGAPLFDQRFDIEGAVDVIEIYTGARALAATGNTLAAQATEDIERQMGGTIEQQPEAYTTRTVVRRAEDIKASVVMGVTLVHGADDGLVPYPQSREMQSRLLALSIPTDMITVGTRGESSEPGTTLTGSLGAPGYESPFAGHADEASTTHIVGNTGFERLAAYFESGETPHCREFVVDGATRTITQVPGTGGC